VIKDKSAMLDVIFREYDIRGKVGSEFAVDQAYDLARAIAYYFVQENPAVKKVAVGMDGRTHSPAIKEKIVQGLRDSGLDVVFIGLCSSPVLYFALHTDVADAGLMITASHNPKEYNGIKICLGRTSVWGPQIQEILKLFKAKKSLEAHCQGALTDYDAVAKYIDYLVQHFTSLHGMTMPVVIDCGNATGGVILPSLIEKMQWPNVRLLFPEVDGNYPNHEADPVCEENMRYVQQALAETDAILGMGLDGDCDRMAPMTKDGYLVPGDKLLAVFGKDIIEHNPGAIIISDIKSSSGLLEIVERWGGKVYLSPSGHSIIKDQMKKYGAMLGGELSCHFTFNDRYLGYDDGIYAAMRLLELLSKSGKTLHELLADFPYKVSSSEFRMACPEEKKLDVIRSVENFFAARKDASMIKIDGIRAALPYGWGIVRASNTQPMLSLRFESDSHEGLQKIKYDFIGAMAHYFDTEYLKKELGI
jgi:phosphomannomutase/phosphoglucomutase